MAAAIWSASSGDIEAIIKGAPAAGDYKINYTLDPGKSPTASISIEYEFAPVAAALAEAKLVTVMFDIPPVPPVSEAEPAVTAPEPLTWCCWRYKLKLI